MNDLQLKYIKRKLSACRKSCKTPEQRKSYMKMMELFRKMLSEKNKHYSREIVSEFAVLISTGLIIALLLLYLSARLYEYITG